MFVSGIQSVTQFQGKSQEKPSKNKTQKSPIKRNKKFPQYMDTSLFYLYQIYEYFQEYNNIFD